MMLRTKDQIHVSAISKDTMPKGTEFACSEVVGAELLKRHPNVFEKIGDGAPAPTPVPKTIGSLGVRKDAKRPAKVKAEETDEADEGDTDSGEDQKMGEQDAGQKMDTEPKNKAESAAPANKASTRAKKGK